MRFMDRDTDGASSYLTSSNSSLRGATRRGNLIDLNQAQKDCHTTSWFAMTGFWLK